MPLRIPDTLPAKSVLESEGVFVMGESRAMTQDIRPLCLLILNLMPNKVATETQLLRALSNTPLQVWVDLLMVKSHESKNTSAEHLSSFYLTFDQVRERRYDGMIITGAPVEQLPFEQVDYWPELCQIMSWSRTHVTSTFHICWGAQAALYFHYGIPKYTLPWKMSGVFEHDVLLPHEPIARGFNDSFLAPHSRHTGNHREDIDLCSDLKLVAYSTVAGPYIVVSNDGRDVMVMGHSEYDVDTLAQEFERDVAKGLRPNIPVHYFPGDNPDLQPRKTWNAHAFLLFGNWLNYYVYQQTPFKL